ncbi:phosphoribosylaminoimidazolesuccinocarboxamide synthase [bacterium]|nr:phosphoribosylaminoimidazolesuccinocarboxamide synthase [bacterium]
MAEERILHEGKAKIAYATDSPDVVRLWYKDDATAFNGKKKGTIKDKGYFNNAITEVFFKLIEEAGIPTHYIDRPSDREMRVKMLRMIPLEVVVRNVAAGSLSKRLGVPEGTVLPSTILEYYYKDDHLGDPMINESHIQALEICPREDLQKIARTALRVNDVLIPFLAERNIKLIDFKLEFGYDPEGNILLGDELSPDSCRFWDSLTSEKMDKDRFRRDLGQVEEFYAEVLRRITS